MLLYAVNVTVVVGVCTFVLLTIAMWSSSVQAGGGGPGNLCKYDPRQGLAVGCQNIDKCRRGDANHMPCCLAVENCASINTYVYKDHPDYFYYCFCGRVVLAPCPKRSTYIAELGQCKHKDTGLLIKVADLLS